MAKMNFISENFNNSWTNKVKFAMIQLTKILQDLRFKNLLKYHNYVLTNETPCKISEDIFNIPSKFTEEDKPLRIIGYYKRFSNAYGYTYVNTREIYINTKYSRSVEDLRGTIAHELCHIIGYTHGDNKRTDYKENSVPYFVGFAAKYFNEFM